MVYVLDALVVLVFLFAIWRGYRQGFIKAMTDLAAFAVAVAVATTCSMPVATGLYDKQIGPSLEVSIAQKAESMATSATDNTVDTVVAVLPDFVKNTLELQGMTSSEAIRSSLPGIDTADVQQMAAQVTENVVRPVVIPLLKVLVTLVLIVLVSVLVRILLGVLDKVFKLPLLRQFNRALGIIPGVINGVIAVLVLTAVIGVIAMFSAPDALINQSLVDNAPVIGRILGINPLMKALFKLIPVAG